MRCRALAVSIVIIVGCVPSLGAQSAPDSARATTSAEPQSGWLTGASIGVPGAELGPILELFTVGIHGTQLRAPGRLGFDYSIGTMPRIIAEGVIVLGARAGVALPLTLSPRALLLPSTGVSLIGAGGAGGGGGVAGLNIGISGVAFGTTGTGLRVGVTWHRFQDTRAAVWLVEMGVVGIRGREGPRCRC